MRLSVLLAIALVLLVLLPVVGMAFFPAGSLVRVAAQLVLSLVLLAVFGGTGIFGYICIRAQAVKWGAGLIVVAIVSLLLTFWMWTGRPLLVI